MDNCKETQEQGSANPGPANDNDEGESSESPVFDPLCARCKAIDFNKILCDERETINHPEEQVTIISSLGPLSDWEIDSCAFCKALFTMFSKTRRSYAFEKYFLVTTSSKQRAACEELAEHYPLLAALPQRTIVVLRRNLRYEKSHQVLIPQKRDKVFVRILNSSTVDYDVLKSWLSVCLKIHTKICPSKNCETAQHLRFIDCKTRKLVPAGSHPYATLSYVWGDNQSPPVYSEQLGHSLPPTIEDAIHVTLKLGYRYLWVDRYCINQQGNEAISQIQQMGSIYRNSEFTIIAAAGSDPFYGLPGVSRSRLPQAAVRLGELQLVNPGSVAASVIEECRWSTRGWTFQEAYLSKRRIVFTDEQVYYECSGMYSYESLNLPLEKMHGEGDQILDQQYMKNSDGHNGGKIVLFPGGVGNQPLDIFNYIMSFSLRSFTYPSDKLMGFLGILKEFETGPHRVRNIWGSPILPTQSTPDSYNVTNFLANMAWTCMFSDRIVSLPSWSWVGWDGQPSFRDGRNFQSLDQARPVTVDVELITGQVLDWNAFHNTYAKLNDFTKLSHFIHISGWTIPIITIPGKGPWCRTQLLFRDGCYMPLDFDTHDCSFRSDSYTGILLVYNENLNISKRVFMLNFC
jgi:hypothetical protein